jgi:putative ABC transport system permease protein
MKFLPYLLKHLRRNWVRTLSTVAAISVCIFLFCTLRTVIAAVNWGLQSANASRLITRHATSLAYNVPRAHKSKLASTPGVRSVAIASWFGGSLRAKQVDLSAPANDAPDFANFFANFAIEAPEYLAMYPEYQVPAAEKQAFLDDQRGCLIGRDLAKRFGWKVGDTFFLESFIPPYRKPDGPFEFVVRGIYDVDSVKDAGADARLMFFHYKYLFEATGQRVGAGTYVIEIADPAQAGAISKAIDEEFANSSGPTKTETEAAFRASFVSLAGNLTALLNGIGLAVTFTILLVTANTMSMAVRERRTEIAVLKTLGFPSARVMSLILGEALLLGLAGGLLGIGMGVATIRALPSVPMLGDAVRQFPNLGLSWELSALALTVSLGLGFAAGFVPALLAYRARITDMLRQV